MALDEAHVAADVAVRAWTLATDGSGGESVCLDSRRRGGGAGFVETAHRSRCLAVFTGSKRSLENANIRHDCAPRQW
jgi:hypothetical protein